MPHGFRRLGCLLRIFLLWTFSVIAAIIIFPALAYSQPALLAEHAYIRKAHQFDRGAVHVFLKNPGAAAVEVEEVCFNGARLEDLPNATAVWTQVLPNSVPPGEVSDLTIMLPRDAANYKLPLEVKVKLQTGEILTIPVDRVNGPFKITGSYFSDNLDQVYIYLQNTGQTSLIPRKVWPAGMSPAKAGF